MPSPRDNLREQEMPYQLPPDKTLRNKIGKHVVLSKIFMPEKMQHCQQLMDRAQEQLLAELQEQIVALGNEYMQAVEDAMLAPSMLQKASDLSLAIKKKTEALGLSFGFEVAKSLHDFLFPAPDCTPETLIVVCKHVAVLNLIIKEGITGDGGAIGKETLANLKALIRKVES